MTLLPQLESELLAAHGRVTGRRRWRHRWPGGVAVGLAAVVALAVVALAIVLVRHGQASTPPSGHSPPVGTTPTGPTPPTSPTLLGPHPSRARVRERNYLIRAQVTANQSDPACVPSAIREQATVSQGSPDPSLLRILGVLRRPAEPTDKLPTRVVGLNHTVIPNGSLPRVKEIYVRYIRRARWRFGAGYYIVPAGDVNPLRPVPARCAAEQQDALEHELPRIPAQLRAGTLALEPLYLANWRYDRLPHPGVCLLALNSTGGGDVGCGMTASDIESGHTVSTGGPTGVPVAYGLVPDGVATVTYYFAGRHAGRPITVHAIGNVFIVPLRRRAPEYGFAAKMVWRSATGDVIQTIGDL
ncbi:MAG: hypothetical protein ACTHMY_31580 [Solirubrobacteraceae bacterium]